MHADSPHKAHALLHKALPLMRNLNIAPTPYNYGIWYEYVRQSSPKLNRLMDSTISRLGNLPSFASKELFHQFLIAEEARYNDKHQDRLESLTSDLSAHTQVMEKSLSTLNNTLGNSRKALKQSNDPERLTEIIDYLEQGTQQASNSLKLFSTALAGVNEEISQLKAELQSLKDNIDLDPMTQLLNQKGLERQLYERIPQSEDDLSLLLLDIDHLKAINDQLSKKAGTALICYIGKILLDRKTDDIDVARIEGGTFAILLNDTTLDLAIEYAESLRQYLNRQRLKSKNGEGVIEQIKVSIGVATVIGQESPMELIARASRYLDNAKQQGRNRTVSR